MNYIYLHGFASSPASSKATYFRERFAELGLELKIPALDGGDFEHLTVTGQLRIIEEMVGESEATILGSSLGGYLAALYAARHDRVQAIVLMAPAFCFAHRWRDDLGDEIFEQWRATGKRTVFHYGEGRERSIGYQIIEDGLNYEDYPSLKCPALVMHGIKDDVVPVDFSREYQRRYPAKVKLIEYDSDHTLGDVTPALWEETRAFLFRK